MKPDLPIYKVILDESEKTGVFAMSFVQSPAVERDFIYFSEPLELISFQSDEHRIVTGVVLRPNQLIYRNSNGFEYYIQFDKEAIEKARDKFHKYNYTSSVTLEHASPTSDVYVVESYLVNRSRQIVPVEFADIEDGAWILSYKIDNLELWNSIKESNKFNGFSIEAVIIPELVKNSKINKINKLLENIKNFS